MTVRMLSRDEIKSFAPRARKDCIDALLGAEQYLREAGILDSELTLSHFMGQVGAETDGMVIVRESMNYGSVGRICQVWPSRAKRVTADLVHNEHALANWAYNGRMGNRPGTDDGFNFRGGGFIQTTGREAVGKYCKAIGIPLDDGVLDDPKITIRFACFEWQQAGCGRYAQLNDLLAVSKIINTGSAKSGVMPNGMNDRRVWFKRAWEVWGDQRKSIATTSGVTADDLAKAGSTTINHGRMLQRIGIGGAIASAAKGVMGTDLPTGAADVPHEVIAQLPASVPVSLPPLPVPVPDVFDHISNATAKVETVTSFASSGMSLVKGLGAIIGDNFWIVCLALSCAGIFYARKIIWRRVQNARLGLDLSRLHRLGAYVAEGVGQAPKAEG